VLQHVVEPGSVAAELVRVVAPGSPVVVTDPDQASLVIEGPDPTLTEIVAQWRKDGVRNGYLAGHMHEVLESAGCVDVGAERFVEIVEEVPLAFGLATWSEMLVEQDRFTAAQATAFDASLAAAAAEGRFAYRIEIVVTWGRRR
jgi:hypothetical protein